MIVFMARPYFIDHNTLVIDNMPRINLDIYNFIISDVNGKGLDEVFKEFNKSSEYRDWEIYADIAELKNFGLIKRVGLSIYKNSLKEYFI